MSNHSSEATPLELFRLELEKKVEPVNDGLLLLEADPGSLEVCDSLIHSLHSVNGAAGIVELPTLMTVAHRLEDFFVAVKNGKAVLSQQAFAVGFRCVDLFQVVSRLPAAGIRDCGRGCAPAAAGAGRQRRGPGRARAPGRAAPGHPDRAARRCRPAVRAGCRESVRSRPPR